MKNLYENVDKNFYHDQTESKNPLRKWFHLNRYKIARSLVRARYENGLKIVDLGCGSCDWNTDHLGVLGIDLNEGLLKVGKEEARLADYKIVDAFSTGLPSESFDIITSFEFLEHVHDYDRVITEMMRLLKKGGHCIISVPFDVPISLWRPLFFLQVIFQGYILQNTYYKQHCGHINHFSTESIKEAFERKGFIIDLVFVMRKLTIFLCARKPGEITKPGKPYEDVTIILPTLNEEKNIVRIIKNICSNYPGCKIIVSDDGSNDRTRENVISMPYPGIMFLDRAVKSVHGLTASVLDAIENVKTKFFIVMDADGQHPYQKIREMVNILGFKVRLVIASRVQVEEGWGFARKAISYFGTLVGKTILLLRGKNYLSFDILGGFFGCETLFWKKSIPAGRKQSYFRLKGYKVLFDFLKHAPARLEIDEVYYRFETRKAEISKFNLKVHIEYMKSCFMP